MIAGTQAGYQSDAEPTKHTPYLALTGESFVNISEINWPCYNGTALYIRNKDTSKCTPDKA